MLEVNTTLFINPGQVTIAGQPIAISNDTVHFAITLSDWVFVSPTDRLVLNVSLLALTSNMTHVVGLSMSSSIKVDYEVETPKGGLPRLAVYLSDQATLELPQYADLDGRIDEINVALFPSDDSGLILSLTFPPVTNSLTYHAMLRGPTSHSSGSIGSTTNNGKKTKHVESWAVGGVLLGLLGFVLFVAGLHCNKKAPRVKIDFSKIIP